MFDYDTIPPGISMVEKPYGENKVYIVLTHDETGFSTEGYIRDYKKEELVNTLLNRLQDIIDTYNMGGDSDIEYDVEFEADFFLDDNEEEK